MLKRVHFWDIDGFVIISDKVRSELEKPIKGYGVRRLSRNLSFDTETIYSIYRRGRKNIHSIYHLVKIAKTVNYDLHKLENEITHYGRIQTNMYRIGFPFIPNPLHLRAVTIHGDGSYNKKTFQAEWYQKHKNIIHMGQLLKLIFGEHTTKPYKKNKSISSVTIPSILIKLVCKSLGIGIGDFYSRKFFERVSKLPLEYRFQVFAQFIVDEGHFKNTTLTISQHKQDIRKGFMILLDSLGLDHSTPKNNRNDITIYVYNYPKIIEYLNGGLNTHGDIAGLWFREKIFRDVYKKCNPKLSRQIIESTLINKNVFNEIKKKKNHFSYEDIRIFGRTSKEANKVIRNWKKNGLIIRIEQNRYQFS